MNSKVTDRVNDQTQHRSVVAFELPGYGPVAALRRLLEAVELLYVIVLLIERASSGNVRSMYVGRLLSECFVFHPDWMDYGILWEFDDRAQEIHNRLVPWAEKDLPGHEVFLVRDIRRNSPVKISLEGAGDIIAQVRGLIRDVFFGLRMEKRRAERRDEQEELKHRRQILNYVKQELQERVQAQVGDQGEHTYNVGVFLAAKALSDLDDLRLEGQLELDLEDFEEPDSPEGPKD